MAGKPKNQDALERARDFHDDCSDYHDEFIRGVKKRSDAYHALKDVRADPSYSGWRNAHFAPYVMHIVDSTLASMVEDRLKYQIVSRPTLEDLYDPTYEERSELGRKAHEILFDWQVRNSKFTRIQRPFLLQQAIARITVAKTTWHEKVQRRRRLKTETKPLLDEYGDVILDPVKGTPMTYDDLVETTEDVTVYDGPMTDVVDVHDFFWPKNALSLETATGVDHRVYYTWEELEAEFGDDGMYGPENGGWSLKKVRDLLGTVDDSSAAQDLPRWSQTGLKDHGWKKIEVIEHWDMLRREKTCHIGGVILLSHHKTLPYFHEATPFTVCTTQPDLFQMEGISQVEKVMALQELLWKIQNQSVDNLELINNAIVIFNPALEHGSSLPFYPGASWAVEDPDLVQMWAPNPIPAEISLSREGLIKGDMQNVAATFPFSSGAESQTVDQKTATGASIVSALAQRSIDLGKQPVFEAWEDIGQMRVILNGQFIREATVVEVLGINGEKYHDVIEPAILAGDFGFVMEPIPDAIMKQETQAKATAMLQTLLQAAQLILPLAQAGAAKMINFDKVLEYFFEAYGIENSDQFFIAPAPQAQLPAPGGGGGTPSPEQPMGITGQNSIDPSVSPSAMVSQSPETAVQRAQALGGGRNV